jgi:hypothetical protein
VIYRGCAQVPNVKKTDSKYWKYSVLCASRLAKDALPARRLFHLNTRV